MNYTVIEQQTTGGITSILTNTESTLPAALSSFFIKAGYAVISQAEVHSVSILTEDGRLIRPSEVFRHSIEPQNPEEVLEEEEPEEIVP